MNSKILEWYKQYCKQVPSVQLVCQDAMAFLKSCSDSYDLILVDVYNDLNVPDQFHNKDVLTMLKSLLSPNGMLIFNKVVANSTHKSEAYALIINLSQVFRSVKTNIQFDLNRFFVCQNKT